MSLTLNAATVGGGATLGTDTVSGSPNIDYQIVKLGYGSAGATPTQVDLTHGLPVNLVAGGIPGFTDNVAGYTLGTSQGLAFFALYLDSATVTSNRAGIPRMSAARQLLVGPQAVVNGGATAFSPIVCTNSTNAANIKGSAGTLYSLQLFNAGSALAYLKVFDKATAATLGTDSPLLNIPIPFNSSGGGVAPDLGAVGISFANGIQLAVTAGEALLDATALGATPHVLINGSFV